MRHGRRRSPFAFRSKRTLDARGGVGGIQGVRSGAALALVAGDTRGGHVANGERRTRATVGLRDFVLIHVIGDGAALDAEILPGELLHGAERTGHARVVAGVRKTVRPGWTGHASGAVPYTTGVAVGRHKAEI